MSDITSKIAAASKGTNGTTKPSLSCSKEAELLVPSFYGVNAACSAPVEGVKLLSDP